MNILKKKKILLLPFNFDEELTPRSKSHHSFSSFLHDIQCFYTLSFSLKT